LLDEPGDDGRLGHVDSVIGGGLGDGRFGPLGHGALLVRGIMWSLVVTRYQDGLVRQAGSETASFSASAPFGINLFLEPNERWFIAPRTWLRPRRGDLAGARREPAAVARIRY
jgi:hypothetical protein